MTDVSLLAGKEYLPAKPVLDTARENVARLQDIWAQEKAPCRKQTTSLNPSIHI